SGTVDTAAAQIPSIQAAIQAHANAIVIAGNDAKALCPSLNQAAQQGIKVLSFDSDVACGDAPNHLFLNQADTKTIGTSTVGIQAAAQYLNTHKSLLSKLVLTGLGLPSQMKPYVLDGTVKEFELWNPSNLGYLAGYAAAALASGTATLSPGSAFTAGSLGSY